MLIGVRAPIEAAHKLNHVVWTFQSKLPGAAAVRPRELVGGVVKRWLLASMPTGGAPYSSPEAEALLCPCWSEPAERSTFNPSGADARSARAEGRRLPVGSI